MVNKLSLIEELKKLAAAIPAGAHSEIRYVCENVTEDLARVNPVSERRDKGTDDEAVYFGDGIGMTREDVHELLDLVRKIPNMARTTPSRAQEEVEKAIVKLRN